ncbi:MAG: hypothetical protein F4Y44_02540 [Chloroflexi bacterium]|nr:hypothetical protein [Chloroflexota bacterium]
MVAQNRTLDETDAFVDALFGPEKDSEIAENLLTPLPIAANSERHTERTKEKLPLDRPNIRAVVSVELRISGVS